MKCIRLSPTVALTVFLAVSSPFAAAQDSGPVEEKDAGGESPAPPGSDSPSVDPARSAAPAVERDDLFELEYDEIVVALRTDYPDIVTLARQFAHLVRLEARVGEALRAGTGEDSAARRQRRIARVGFLLAELFEAVGETKRARDLWLELARQGDSPEQKAHALHDLGFYYMMRQRYSDAWKYWGSVAKLAPESEWAANVSHYEPFLRMVQGEEVPIFRGRFGKLGEKSLKSLRGQWVLVDFWKSDAPGARGAAERLRVAVDHVRNAGWKGVVLGVNLDEDRDTFRDAMKNWLINFRPAGGGKLKQVPTLNWPQHHDGRGFESPIVKALAIPRVPLQILIDPQGRAHHVTQYRWTPGQDGGRSRVVHQGTRFLEAKIRKTMKSD